MQTTIKQTTMRAVRLAQPTPASMVTLCDAPIPEVKPGWVLVKVKAFGLNHSEQILRLNEIQADYISKPIIPGIECVGEIADPSDSAFRVGQKVAALMGGMGRSFNGSYARVCASAHAPCFRCRIGPGLGGDGGNPGKLLYRLGFAF